MKYTVTNNSSAPHDLMTTKGRVVVLAGKSVEVDFAPEIVPVYEAVPFFDVIPASDAPNKQPIPRDPLDHDNDGRKGGSLPAEKRGPGRPRKAD